MLRFYRKSGFLMSKVKRFLAAAFLLVVFMCSVVFFRLNTALVELQFGPWATPPHAVSVWVIISFLCGSFVGILIGIGLFQRLKAKYALRNARIEIESLRLDLQRLKAKEH